MVKSVLKERNTFYIMLKEGIQKDALFPFLINLPDKNLFIFR